MKPHFLRVIDGPEKGREFALKDGAKLVVGRGTVSDTQINDPRVSRVHCQVQLKNGEATLTADRSAGPTTVAGQAVTERRLAPGEVFRIGDTFIRLDDGENPLDQTTMGGNDIMETFVGSSFAHYRLDALLARGTTGVVFKATDTEKNRPAAVKVLLPRVSATEEQRERFVRAMRTMLPIKHPNIVPLYNAGKRGKFCWVAMDFIDGEGMDQVIRRLGVKDMLDWRQVWEVAVDIGRALKCAGDHKIIHRNLSPANIIRRQSDRVNLLGDLMLAKAVEGNYSFDVTAPGQLVGEIAYMSPERTQCGTVDARSDIYELGATLYALLTGRPPFESASQVDQIERIRTASPIPPKQFQISINDMFQDVVLTLLAKRPQDRYPSAETMLQELERVGRFAGLTRN